MYMKDANGQPQKVADNTNLKVTLTPVENPPAPTPAPVPVKRDWKMISLYVLIALIVLFVLYWVYTKWSGKKSILPF